ncbi:341_t:CDS:2, partial [Ambispora leptoticha]
ETSYKSVYRDFIAESTNGFMRYLSTFSEWLTVSGEKSSNRVTHSCDPVKPVNTVAQHV